MFQGNSDRTITKEEQYEKPPLSFVQIKLLGLTSRWKFHASILCQVNSCFDKASWAFSSAGTWAPLLPALSLFFPGHLCPEGNNAALAIMMATEGPQVWNTQSPLRVWTYEQMQLAYWDKLNSKFIVC